VLSISLPIDAAPQEERRAPPGALKGMRVLVVESNLVIQRVYSEQLVAWGCAVECCPSGAAARERLREYAFQLVLIDWHLPDDPGIELGRALRGEPGQERLGLVMLTSVGQRGDGRIASEAGFDAYLVKPVRMIDLSGALNLVHQARQAGAAPAALVTRHSLAEVRGHGSTSRLMRKAKA
jgi:DNA-binding response OmpR family regulator